MTYDPKSRPTLSAQRARVDLVAAIFLLLLPTTLRSANLPLLYDGCTLRVPAQVSGKAAYLVFDTGSTVSALDRATYLAQLGDPVAEVRASSIGGLTTLTLYRCPELLIGDMDVVLSRIAAIDLSSVKAISGSECDGILGADFDHDRVILINFDQGLLEIDQKLADAGGGQTICLPLKPIGNGNVALDASVDGVPVTFMIDTGDNGSISLNPQDWQRLVASRRASDVHKLLAAAISGAPIQTSGVRINDMSIGPNHYTGFIATAVQNPHGLSTLGLRFLRQHIVTFDFQKQQLYLQPGAQFGEKETSDMSGLHLIRSRGATLVYAVDAGSPAESAGVKAGDILETINHVAAGNLSIRDIRRALKSKDGLTVSLTLQRVATVFDVSLRLKQTL